MHHYFGTKEQVFVAAMELPFDPAERLPQVLAGDPEGLGERLVRCSSDLGATRQFRTPMLGLVRSAFTGEQGAHDAARVRRAAPCSGASRRRRGVDDPLRVQAAAAQIVGVVILRTSCGSSRSPRPRDDELVALVAPTVQRHLVG